MLLENDQYYIEINVDHTYTMDSADNKNYDISLNPNNYKRSDWFKIFSIYIQQNHSINRLALVGSSFSCDVDCAILEKEKLIVLMNTYITVINLIDKQIEKHKCVSDFGTFFPIYRFAEGYVIYGELEIIKINRELEKEWSFSGRDIFVLPNKNGAFAIDSEIIKLIDWDGNKYTIDKYGKEIL